MMLTLSGMALAAGVLSRNSLVGGGNQLLDKQALYIAEAGWQRARQAIDAGLWSAAVSPGNAYTETFGAGEYAVTLVDNGDGTYTLTSDGYVPSQSSPLSRRRVAEVSLPVTVSSGANASLGATASASSSNGANTPDLASDGNPSTRWESGTNGSGSWLAMDYGSATTLNRVVVNEHNFIDDLTIEWSDDASSWTAASGLSVIESPSKTWTATFTADSHRYLRARFTSVPSGKKASAKEMESYNASTTLGAGSYITQW